MELSEKQAKRISIWLGGLLLLITVAYLLQPRPSTVASIEGSLDTPENGLPVYAQFVVTQTLALDSSSVLSHLELPIWSAAPEQAVDITLLHDGEAIFSRQYRTGSQDVLEVVDFELGKLRAKPGVVEVRVSVPGVQDATKEKAPLLFVETADENYPGGNYRIAQNEKSGDIALHLEGLRSRGSLWQLEWQRFPLQPLIYVGWFSLVFLLVVSIPWSVRRWQRHRSRKSEQAS